VHRICHIASEAFHRLLGIGAVWGLRLYRTHAVFWNVASCTVVGTEVSEERIDSIITETRIDELEATLSVTSN
jgi:hypothetical protein